MERNTKPTNVPYSAPIPRVNIPTRNYYPEKNINPALTQELFLRISEGDISRLKDFILTNNITLYVKDDHGNSVLHHVIKNKNFTKSEKIELLNFLIDRGAPIMAFNDENVTSLHLAAKYQVEDIIDILIEKGADPNAIDNQFMTPLHYAVQGYNTDCNNTRKHKVDNIINDTLTKPNELVLQLANSIRNYMKDDVNINRLLVHIKNTINNFNKIYGHENEEFKKNIKNNINQLFSNISVKNEKLKHQIESQASNLRKEIENSYMNKINDTLKPLDINPNQKSGPKDNKILPYNNISDHLYSYSGNIHDSVNKFMDRLRGRYALIDSQFDIIFNATENTMNLIKNLYWYNAGFYINSNDAKNNLAFDMKKYISVDSSKMILLDVALDLYNYVDVNGTAIYGVIDLTASNNVSWDNGVDILKIDRTFGPGPQNIKRGKMSEVNNAKNDYTELPVTDDRTVADPSKIINGTWGKNAQITDNGRRREPSRPIVINPKRDASGNITILPKKMPVNDAGYVVPVPNGVNPTSIASTFGYIDYDYTIVSKIRYYVRRVQYYLKMIDYNNEIFAEFDRSNAYHYYRLTVLNITYLLNCLSYTKLINDELKNIKHKLLSLVKIFDSKLSQQNIQNIPHIFYLDIAKNSCLKIIKEFSDIDVSVHFKNIVELWGDFNSLIDIINSFSLLDYVYAFNNNFETTPITFIQNNKTNNISNIFENIINKINLKDLNFDKFNKLFALNYIDTNTVGHIRDFDVVNNLAKVRKHLIETYLPEIDDANLNNFVFNSALAKKFTYSKLSYVYDARTNSSLSSGIIRYIDDFNKTNPDKAVFLQKLDIEPIGQDVNYGVLPSSIGFVFDTSKITPYNNTKTIFENLGLIGKNVPIMSNGQTAKVGNVGLKDKYDLDKTVSALSIVSHDINVHFKTIKYQVVEYIINTVYNIITDPTNNNAPRDQTIRDLVKKYDDYIIKSFANLKSNTGDFSIVLSTIGKLTDGIINLFLKNYAYTSSQNAADYILKQTTVIPNMSDIYNIVIKNSTYKEIIPEDDYGFKLYLNELIDEVLEKFLVNPLPKNDIDQSYQLNYTTLTLDDNLSDRKNISALYNYSLNSKKIIKQCYSINENVISKLLSKTQVNKKDFAGNTAIFYAIETQNVNTVNSLILNNANVNIKEVKNNIGLTPLDFAKNIYKAHVEILSKSNNFITSLTDPIYEKLKDTIKQNPQYKNNILKYSDIFLPHILILLNHYLFLQTKNYPKNWTFDKMQKLSNIITNDPNSLINPSFPLMNINSEKVQNIGISGTNVLMDKRNIVNNEIENLSSSINQLKSSNNSLALELNSIS